MSIFLNSLKIAFIYSVLIILILLLVYYLYLHNRKIKNNISSYFKKIFKSKMPISKIEKKIDDGEEMELYLEDVLALARNWDTKNIFVSEDGKIIVKKIEEKNDIQNQTNTKEISKENKNFSNQNEHSELNSFKIKETKNGELKIENKNGFMLINQEGFKTKI